MKFSLIKILLLLLVIAGGYYGYKLYSFAHDPLVAGVPPHANVDGTFDYTMFWENRSASISNPAEIQELVLRLNPKYVERPYGDKDMSISGGGIGIASSGHPNIGYYVWLRIADLQPVSTFEYGKGLAPKEPHSLSIVLGAEKDLSADLAETAKRRSIALTKDECVSLNRQEFGLEMFGPDADKSKPCQLGTIYVLWRNEKKNDFAATLLCFPNAGDCTVDFYFEERLVFGKINFSDRDKIVELVPRLQEFIRGHIIADRVYSGTPYVYGEEK